ncbi:glycine cleavage system aminomethyltransferase GcvT [Rhodophyticola sp. CCM32]|uniref:glycine cleavage system aminomethyltransferase GcvT n=1 Tax=Rhodophyticola sp. CCM32 TaxID=2916397 RepID=UPI00107F7028|nr:glycine cleavage system aminomethyltransferase GcvT [Rhodophyticola sp. CCM32]QBY02500.1 glycine cleavage system aminomethyltransferase GcvT [Rhodophyticola sp. CCM32]
MTELKRLPLHALHDELGGKFVPFAGYDMPVQYAGGVMAEHLWCREKAGLFDVSHMGQVLLPVDQAGALEALVPVDVIGLGVGRQRYGLFTGENGGVLDDLMIARRQDDLFLVVNAACKAADIAHLQAHLTGVAPVEGRALLALQGPLAETALARLLPDVAAMRFMDVARMDWQGADLWLSRSGYTGEDGFEISVPGAAADGFARALLEMAEVAPIGLGARDSLRLEAGLPLYGQDLSEEISPIEARLGWAISKIRRADGARAGGFPGAVRILDEMANGAPRRRVGLRPEGRAPMRAGVPLFATAEGGVPIGLVTSGGFGPSVGGPVAMGLIDNNTPDGAMIYGELRGKRLPAVQVALPFYKQSYKR